MIRCLTIAALLSSVITTAIAADKQTDTLWDAVEAQYSQGEVQLRWALRKWPAGLKGFNVERQIEEGPFKQINRHLVWPELTITNARHQTASSVIVRIAEAKLAERPFPLLVKDLAAEKDLPSYCKEMWTDFDLALTKGFAFADVAPPYGKTCRYRVIPLLQENVEQLQLPSSPIATVEVWRVYNSLEIRNVSADALPDGSIRLAWEAPAKDCAALSAFALYRGESPRPVADTGESIAITDAASTADGYRKFVWVDKKPPSTTPKYAVRPMAKDTRTSYDLSPRTMPPESIRGATPPKIDEIEMLPKEARISWGYASLNDVVDAQKVERRVGAAATPQLIATLPPNQRIYRDLKPLPRGTATQYRVGGLIGPQEWFWSEWSDAHPWPGPAPQAPTTAPALTLSEDYTQLNVSWQPLPKLKTYLIETAITGEVWEEAYRGDDVRHTIDVSTLAPNTKLLVRIRAANPEGIIGAASPSASFVGVNRGAMDTPRLAAEPTSDGAIYVSWKMESNIRLKGFRLYNGDERILDIEELGPSRREWRMPAVTPGQTFKLRLATVNSDGKEVTTSETVKTRIKQPAAAKSLPEPPAPKVDLATVEVETMTRYVTKEKKIIDVEFQYVTAADGRRIFHGKKTAYFGKDKPSSILNYHLGKFHGVQKWYGPKGDLVAVQLYQHGKSLTETDYRNAGGTEKLTAEERSKLIP